jgi:hypothetical protein
MKKKQRDDVMGEDESSLPINDGELGRRPICRELWLMCRKCLVAAPDVSQKGLISINYKLGVPTSRRRLSTSVLHVASNGANTKRWFGSGAWRTLALPVGIWSGIREHWDGYEFRNRAELQVASIEVKPVVGASKASILPHESKFGFEVKIQPSFLACLRFARSL